MDKTKRSWYIAKLYKNAAVEDRLGNYTLDCLLDCSSLILQCCNCICLNKISKFFSMGSITKVGTAILMSKHYQTKFFKFKFLPLVSDYLGEYYPILSDRCVLSIWVGFLAKKNS